MLQVNHYLASIGVKYGKVYALFVKSPADVSDRHGRGSPFDAPPGPHSCDALGGLRSLSGSFAALSPWGYKAWHCGSGASLPSDVVQIGMSQLSIPLSVISLTPTGIPTERRPAAAHH